MKTTARQQRRTRKRAILPALPSTTFTTVPAGQRPQNGDANRTGKTRGCEKGSRTKTEYEAAPGQLSVRASVPTHFPFTCSTLVWRANVERGAASFCGIYRGGKTGHAKAVPNREIAPSTGGTAVRISATRTTPLRARRTTNGPLSRIPSPSSCLPQVLGRTMVARRRPPASPLDTQAPFPEALSGLRRSPFRGTKVTGFASIQPAPSGIRPALCAPSGVNLHS